MAKTEKRCPTKMTVFLSGIFSFSAVCTSLRPVKWIKARVSEPPPAREFTEEIHGFREYCKYGHVRQAIAKANP